VIDVDRLYRAQWGRLLSSLIRAFADFDVAEDALQDAFAAAVLEWAASPPNNPCAWLYGTARHRAIDRIRRRGRLATKLADLAPFDERDKLAELAPFDERHIHSSGDADVVPDERLRLIFTCCHPALAPEAQVALTLRTLCGLTTEEIAHAFLVPPATMAQRLVRAKAKIRDAGIPYVVPGEDDLPARLAAVTAVLYLVFNEGYAAVQGPSLVRHDLCAQAIELTRILRSLLERSRPVCPPAVNALLALMLLQDARRHARVDANGEVVLLQDQDRTLWDRAEIDEGSRLLLDVLGRAPPGSYALEAAIAAVHAEALTAQETDWPQIAGLYERLLAMHPSPVVALNRAVAVSMAQGPHAALSLVEALAEPLAEYHLWHATRADLLRRLGRRDEAIASYERAASLTQNEAQKRFLAQRLRALRVDAREVLLRGSDHLDDEERACWR
jgi:RNA polymerase sigma-70 factor (ECF subfamily)